MSVRQNPKLVRLAATCIFSISCWSLWSFDMWSSSTSVLKWNRRQGQGFPRASSRGAADLGYRRPRSPRETIQWSCFLVQVLGISCGNKICRQLFLGSRVWASHVTSCAVTTRSPNLDVALHCSATSTIMTWLWHRSRLLQEGSHKIWG